MGGPHAGWPARWLDRRRSVQLIAGGCGLLENWNAVNGNTVVFHAQAAFRGEPMQIRLSFSPSPGEG
jgi:hypothetical protein